MAGLEARSDDGSDAGSDLESFLASDGDVSDVESVPSSEDAAGIDVSNILPDLPDGRPRRTRRPPSNRYGIYAPEDDAFAHVTEADILAELGSETDDGGGDASDDGSFNSKDLAGEADEGRSGSGSDSGSDESSSESDGSLGSDSGSESESGGDSDSD